MTTPAPASQTIDRTEGADFDLVAARAEATAILRDLVAFPTVSADGNLAMIDYIATRLRACGARVDILHDATGTKANLFATLGPEGDGGLVLSGHTDVVPVAGQPWTTDPFAMTAREGLLFGRGTCDMKGFLAACLALAPVFAARFAAPRPDRDGGDPPIAGTTSEGRNATRHADKDGDDDSGTDTLRDARPPRPLHFAFTHDEEVGCLGAQALVATLRERGLRPAMVLVGEPTLMQVIDAHKGCNEYTTRFFGLEGHGSAPDLGVNAAEYAARFVARLLDLKASLRANAPSDSPFEPLWSTINTGVIEGGTAHNVIPGQARVDWETRPVVAADAALVKQDIARFCSETLLPEMRAVHPGARIETETIGEVDGLQPRARNRMRDLAMDLTGANRAGSVPFGTEAGLFQSLGCDVAICGPGDIAQAHRPDEYLAVEQLDLCLAMLNRLSMRL